MRQKWALLLVGAAVCALSLTVPSLTMTRMSEEAPLDPRRALVEDTFYVTEGIEVDQRLLPTAPGVDFRAAYLAVGVRVDGTGRVYGTPRRAGTYTAPIQLCAGLSCHVQRVTLVVLPNVPWEPRELIFPGRVGAALNGEIGVDGGPDGVIPTFTVTNHAKLPRHVTIGPDGHVGGVPEAPGVSEVPVRICVAGNCAGVVVRLIIV
ncbi:hypothetical protein SAMN05421869_116173 [Nonomuraea jiangxiensis]|uniref:Uncharacterized protein n=2 Tax=Nonomuraea jiangxiensis TaxID=633440 RepID=A0A1G9CHG5_9ACTN|nr:hypothetical protein SAMN05421869_116173 [Nonomuraea jiangxiensis]